LIVKAAVWGTEGTAAALQKGIQHRSIQKWGELERVKEGKV